ncbi:MAG: site-specific DNA-methyltransferase [Prevotella sp.]|nr:site-specific DNA-methyltransferase [Prevotella sp.]
MGKQTTGQNSTTETAEARQWLPAQAPVLCEKPERRCGSPDAKAPVHWLIEADNLPALMALAQTHGGKVDVIYIDPPYNTGHKDLAYNDTFARATGTDGHAAWLSFMRERLIIARQLLSERGVIFISIDQHELARLNLLCNDLFGEQNCLGIITLINNMKGRSDDAHFATCNEFMLVYALHPDRVEMTPTAIDEEEMENDYKLADELSSYKTVGLRKTGKNWRREDRKGMYYPVLQRGGEFFSISDEEYNRIYDKPSDTIDDDYVATLCQQYRQQGFTVHLPIDGNGEKGRWRWGFYNSFRKYYKTELCVNTEGTLCTKMRNRLEDGSIRGKLAKTVWYKAEYDTGVAGKALTRMFGHKVFGHPKAVTHIKDVLSLFGRDITVLDFFAGSGTTMHATMLLNAEDGGTRRCILVTNNENGICHNVTYPRCRMVIEGYDLPGGKHVDGLTNNALQYFITKTTD